MADKLLRVGITHGDINGVGYEIILKLFSDARIFESCIPIVYGSTKIIAYYKKYLELNSVNLNVINNIGEAAANRLNIINCVDDNLKVELGKSTEESRKASFLSLERSVKDISNNKFNVLITSPVVESNMREEIPGFKTQVEYVKNSLSFEGDYIRILAKDDLRIAMATDRVDFKDILSFLTTERVKNKLKLLKKSLVRDFSVTNPRIAVLSINPDSCIGGECGEEEKNIILPAIKESCEENALCVGPYASEDFFSSGMYKKFDATLAMYYDQAVIPFNTLTENRGAEYVAGLPLIMVSPCTGINYEDAGANKTSEESIRDALFLASDIFKSKKFDSEINSNPLKKQYFEKGMDNEVLDLTKDED